MLVAGQILGERFELRRLLGAGGMGEVFAAWDRQQRETVALKSLMRADPGTLARFKKEFRALQGLAHPNLVNLYELVRDGDQWFFTMELIRGQPLLVHVGASPPRPGKPRFIEPRVRDSLGQLVRGLRTLHSAGMIHRDVKPSNVLVTTDERLVLLDFGLITEVDPGRQSRDNIVGSVDYMAPEQASSAAITEAADWYAVGVILYEALTGRVPYSGHAMQVLIDKQQVIPRSPAELSPDAPPDLVELCMQLLAIEPGKRPTGADLATRLGVDDSELRRANTISQIQAVTTFVGRDEEVTALIDGFGLSRRAPRVHLLVGESGIGKSSLVQHVVGVIADSDPQALILRASCYERETVPYKGFDGIADGLADYLSRLPDAEAAAVLPPRAWLLPGMFPALRRVPAIATMIAELEPETEPVEVRASTFAALRALLVAIARRKHLVLTIDDIQWADADSFVLLAEILRGNAPPPMLVIATVRSDGDVPVAVRDSLAGADVVIAKVGRLGDADCRRLAAEAALDRRGRLDVDRLLREAQGHPMFLLELVRYAERSGDLETAPRLEDALWERIDALRAEPRALLEIVCLAGGPVTPEVASAAAGFDPQLLGRAIATLKVTSLVREVARGRVLALEPYHDRIRAAVLARVPAGAQQAGHRRLANAIEASQDRDPHQLLRHQLLAGSPERAAVYAEQAATHASAAHAFDQAAALWRQALELCPHSVEDVRRLRIRIGEALIGAGRGADAAEQYLLAAEGADPAARLEYRRHAAEQLLINGRIERGVAALEQLLNDIGVGFAKKPRRALTSLLWNRAVLRIRGLGFKERHRREIAETDLLAIESLKAAAHGLALVDAIRGADFQARCTRLSLTKGSRFEVSRALIFEGMFRSTQGDIERAEWLINHALEVAPPDNAYLSAMNHGALGCARYFAGDLEGCVQRLTDADRQMRRVPGANWERASSRIFMLFALRFIGDFPRLRVRFDEFLQDARQRGDLYLDSTARRSCIPLWFAADTPEVALAELDSAKWMPPATAFHVQHFHEMLALGELRLYGFEHVDVARFSKLRGELEASLLLRVASIRQQLDYLDARLALAASGAPPSSVAKAAKRLLRTPNPVAMTWGHVISAGYAARRGDDAGALASLEAAAKAADVSGMRATGAVARWLIGRRLGGDAGDAIRIEAETTLGKLGVKRIPAFVALTAPGL